MKLKTLTMALPGLILTVAGLTNFAHAGLIVDTVDTGVYDSTVTFDEHSLADLTLITNQFSDVGVTFTGNQIQLNGCGKNTWGATLGQNFINTYNNCSTPSYLPTLNILFSETVDKVSLAIFNDVSLNFTTFLNNVELNTYNSGTTRRAIGYNIFDESAFNEIRINATTTRQYVAIGNIAYNKVTDVPEPSTLAILALGIMGLASRRLKKKS